MAKLNCPCGEQLSNVCVPNNIEGILLQDVEIKDNSTYEEIQDTGRSVWECKACGRLAFNYPLKDDSRVKWYVPEDGKPGGLMDWSEAH